MKEEKPNGLEKSTLIEHVTNFFPGPFFVKCLLFWIVFGTPGLILSRYLDTLNIHKTLDIFGQVTLQNVFVFSLANFLIPLYAFYGTHYMRVKLVDTIPQIEPVTVKKNIDHIKFFDSVSRLWPALVIAVIFGAISIFSLPGQASHIVGYASAIIKIIGFSFIMLAYGTFIWMYISSIRGLYRIGKEHLHFISFYEDAHMGMKSFGSLSLAFAWVYFVGIILTFFSVNPLPILILMVVLVLIVFGILLFFFPTYNVHKKMVHEKQTAEKALRLRLSRIIKSLEHKNESPDEILDLFLFQTLEQKVSKIAVWPFDAKTLSWFSAIVITVLGTEITRLLIGIIGI